MYYSHLGNVLEICAMRWWPEKCATRGVLLQWSKIHLKGGDYGEKLSKPILCFSLHLFQSIPSSSPLLSHMQLSIIIFICLS